MVPVRCAMAMIRIMGPDRPPPVTAPVGVMEPIVTEEVVIDIHAIAEPVRAPPPTAPTSPPVVIEAEVEAVPEAEAEPRVVERGIIAVNRRPPNVDGIIGRHIYHLRVGRLNNDDLLPAFRLGRNRLLWCR